MSELTAIADDLIAQLRILMREHEELGKRLSELDQLSRHLSQLSEHDGALWPETLQDASVRLSGLERSTRSLEDLIAKESVAIAEDNAAWDAQLAATDETRIAAFIAEAMADKETTGIVIENDELESSKPVDPYAKPSFWRDYTTRPPDVRRQTVLAYRQWLDDPNHPSLHFKQINPNQPLCSVRVSLGYLALCVLEGDKVVWLGILSHGVYDRLLR